MIDAQDVDYADEGFESFDQKEEKKGKPYSKQKYRIAWVAVGRPYDEQDTPIVVSEGMNKKRFQSALEDFIDGNPELLDKYQILVHRVMSTHEIELKKKPQIAF